MHHHHSHRHAKRYGFGHLLLDFILVLMTQGLWLIWIIIRFIRSNTR